MNTAHVRCAAILAGGSGTRMGHLGQIYPKAALPICNQPLIHRQLRILLDSGIEDVVVLVGHEAELVRQTVERADDSGLHIRFVLQQHRIGAAQALAELQPHVQTPFLLVLGDIFFVPRDLRDMFSSGFDSGAAAVVATRLESDSDAARSNFSVQATESGRITRVVEKPSEPAPLYKGVGIYLFDESIFDALARTPPSPLRGERELTDAIQSMIDAGELVIAADVVEDDVNLNTAKELLKANLSQLRFVGSRNLVGSDCHLDADVRLNGCIVGAGATITAPADLSNCLVFESSCLYAPGTLSQTVVTPDGAVSCAPAETVAV